MLTKTIPAPIVEMLRHTMARHNDPLTLPWLRLLACIDQPKPKLGPWDEGYLAKTSVNPYCLSDHRYLMWQRGHEARCEDHMLEREA